MSDLFAKIFKLLNRILTDCLLNFSQTLPLKYLNDYTAFLEIFVVAIFETLKVFLSELVLKHFDLIFNLLDLFFWNIRDLNKILSNLDANIFETLNKLFVRLGKIFDSLYFFSSDLTAEILGTLYKILPTIIYK